jgi:hypothetical protein
MKHKAKWVNGRWRIATKESGSNIWKEIVEVEKIPDELYVDYDQALLPVEETYRTERYQNAVRATLYQEYKSLSGSTIEGVLAEQNYSYSLSRPILLGLAAKSWRNAFSSFVSKWKKSSKEASEKHYMLLWSKPSSSGPISIPKLRETGDPELDEELYQTVLKPILDERLQAQEAINIELANILNEQEAEQANALFECECCFSDTTFERMATCTTGAHTICFTCIQHAVSEALYGQSWGRNIDHTRAQLACLAPSDSTCDGCIPRLFTRRAVLGLSKGGPQTWQKLESRLADEALLKCQAPLIQCPFCAYAEIDILHLPPGLPSWRFNTSHPFRALLLLFLALLLAPLLSLYVLSYRVFSLASPCHLIHTSLSSLTRKTHLANRFRCRSPACLRASCIQCRKPWRDPHICYESATLSLRTTIEAARTAALKRTCPRCGLGFVKESGCNKMVCVCGYAMCYICRQGLGRKSSTPPRPGAPQPPRLGLGAVPGGDGAGAAAAAAPEADDEGEGYRHFCQHFRPAGGRCTECERCDLYRGENEAEMVKRAGEVAEREWRVREGLGKDVVATAPGGRGRWWWTMQEVVDGWVEGVLKC